ncbi:FtsQ-type POTRA domain-containing protein [Peptoniphilus sp. MSJ-1]|uniref:FtsQ-type POTRA domain-containing protein n=1 Tax=Peptoniphilus ovalis TaxID=2841503 RepID=A0ABS6FGJ0_9FIRM|nr:FtsQ-type POTRA domain-containing protein [Peptoniphilus ovalis]MBU5669086.1 FtsQ-type POTRA domain-containing protein [Peptoniphilus ovalis]
MEKHRKPRRKLNKRKRYFRIFSRFFMLFLFTYLIIFALRNSNIFNISNVIVEGNNKVSISEIKKAAGIERGNKYFEVAKKDRISNIKNIPYIKDADIKYSLGGDVKIIVKERTPYYQIESSEYLLVDEEFRILENSDSKSENLINLIGLNVEDPQPGKYILNFKEDEEKKNLLIELKNPDYKLQGNIKDIELLDSIATFVTIDGIKIEFGSYSNISYKLKMLSLILEDIKNTDKNALTIQMEKGENPILITDDSEKNKSSDDKNDDKDKRYVEKSKENV